MKITMLTIGTRGEVQPCIALGLGLQAAGHKVSIATHATFETFVHDSGLGFSLIRVPFDWLFPQMAAVVHHGGAGTTAASLRAGIPSIVVPFFMDQPFWGQRVANLGVGPQPIPRKQLSVERLAAAITTALTYKEMQRRAAALGERIRAEDGVARAVEVINRYLSSR